MAGSTEYVVNIVIQSKDKSSAQTDKATKGLDLLKKAAGAAGIAFGALKTAQAAVDFAKMGAAANRQAKSLDGLAKSAGTSGKAIVSAIQDASNYTIDRMTAMSAANKAMMLDVAKSPEQFERLTKVATSLGKAMGQDAAKSIDDFVVAAGRQSMQIADNLGLTIKAEAASKRYAKQIGKTAGQLTAAEKKQAFLNEMLIEGERKMSELGDTGLDTAGKIEKTSAALADLKTNAAAAFAEAADASGALDFVSDGTRAWAENSGRLVVFLNAAGTAISSVNNNIFNASDAIDGFNNELKRNLFALEESTTATEQLRYAHIDAGNVIGDTTNKLAYMDTATLASVESDGMLEHSILAAITAIDSEKEALGLAESATYSQVMAAQSLKLAEDELKASTEASSMALLAMSEQLMDASSAQIAQAAIAQLKLQLDAGKITFDEYQSAVSETQLEFGLANEKSVILAAGVASLAAKLASGEIKAANYAESLGKIIESSGRAARAAESMATALNNIPRNIDVSINVRESIGRRESQAGPGPGPRMQHGGAFTVPPGYPNDTFPMRVSSGERVIVIPRSQTTNNNFTLNSSTMASQPRINESFQMMQELAG